MACLLSTNLKSSCSYYFNFTKALHVFVINNHNNVCVCELNDQKFFNLLLGLKQSNFLSLFADTMICNGCCVTLDHIVTYLFKQLSQKGKIIFHFKFILEKYLISINMYDNFIYL